MCESLTALQGLFAPRQYSAGQHARRGQSLQGQHVLTLLPERQTETGVNVDKMGEQVIKEGRTKNYTLPLTVHLQTHKNKEAIQYSAVFSVSSSRESV